MATSPGRNDPCPCGSGRKFKHCCLIAQDAEAAARMRLRAAEGRLVPKLFAYAADAWGDAFFDEAWEEFFGRYEVPDAVDDSREFGTTFDPFFVFSFVPDQAEGDLPDGWPTEPVALHVLHHEAEFCPDVDREFMLQACRSHASFFVVESATPGRAIDLKDILTGRRFRVLEQSASGTLRPGDLTFTRVVTAGGASIMIGAAPWVIPASWHTGVIDFRERVRRRGLMTRGDLLEYEIDIRQLYHQIVNALVHPRLPTLKNTDGDPIEMTTMTYELGMGTSEAVERLRPLATIDGEAHIDGETYDAAGALTSAGLSWITAGNRQHKSWDNTILGSLRLEGSRLVVEVNSARRRDRIQKEIATRLGSAATLVETTVTDVTKELEGRRTRRAAGAGAAERAVSKPDRTPEVQALEAELARRHWDAWIAMKIPALGNRTPRQAAKTAAGRERLEALLSDFERHAERAAPGFAPDVAALRRKLRV